MNLVSIIIPCYNYGWLLAETLESVLKQYHVEWECLVIDDGSSDNTKQVAESFAARDARIKYVYQVNGGMSNARNNGLRLAKGKYIQFLDSDDLLAPDKLSIQVTYLEANPDVDIVYSDVRFFQHEDAAVISRSFDMRDTPWLRRVEGKGEVAVGPLVEYNDIVINSPLTRASLIQKAGPFDEQLRSVEDWEFWVRCAIAGANFKYLPTDERAWALVRVHPTSTSQNRGRMLEYTFRMRQQLGQALAQAGHATAARLNRENLQTVIEKQAIRSFAQGHKGEGFKKFWLLARMTDKYLYYLKSGVYWLRNGASNSEASEY
jgi:glycosyltransferase involved in cell wall biosynthesis